VAARDWPNGVFCFCFACVCVFFFMVACLTLTASLNVLIFVGLCGGVRECARVICACGSVVQSVTVAKFAWPFHAVRGFLRVTIIELCSDLWFTSSWCDSGGDIIIRPARAAHKSHGLARPAEPETGCDVNHGVLFSRCDII